MCQDGVHTCQCPAGRTERFLQPTLLLVLHEGSSYGYEMIEKVSRFGFVDDAIDPAIIYRHLRRLEADGFVSSTWDTSGTGPARRYYSLTREGEELLRNWIPFMERSRDALSRFLEAFRNSQGDKHKI